MLNSTGRGTEKQIGEKAVAVRTHCDEIAAFLFDPVDDFLDWIAICQFRLGGDTRGLKLCSNLLQVCSVLGDFRTDRIGTIGSSSPSIGHIKQHYTAAREFRELFDVFNNRPVSRRAVQRHENRPLVRTEASAPFELTLE